MPSDWRATRTALPLRRINGHAACFVTLSRPAPPAPFAIIAGTRRLAVSNPISWTSMRRFAAGVSHDGTVAVDETRLPDAADFLTVDATHTWIMNEPAVHAAVISFFRTGRFATRPRT